MTFYTLTQTHPHADGTPYWSLFVLLSDGGSITGKFLYWQHAREFVSRRWLDAVELTEAEMWRETMRREMAVACV